MLQRYVTIWLYRNLGPTKNFKWKAFTTEGYQFLIRLGFDLKFLNYDEKTMAMSYYFFAINQILKFYSLSSFLFPL